MRCVTYAGESVFTTNDVAAALIELTAAVAKQNRADAVKIPIVLSDRESIGTAELVIGVGNDVLSVPEEWDGPEPDFSAGAHQLRSHHSYPGVISSESIGAADLDLREPDFGEQDFDINIDPKRAIDEQ